MMSSMRTLATPLTIGSFIALCITGLCMLAGYRQGLINPLHELSSLLFVAGSILHVIVHWKPTLAHLKRPLGAVLAVGFLIVTALAVVPKGQQKGDPRRVLGQTAEIFLDANLQQVGAITQQPEQVLAHKLAQAGFGTGDPTATLRDIARSSNKNSMEILAAVLPDKQVR